MGWGCCPECGKELVFGDYLGDDEGYYVECPDGHGSPNDDDDTTCKEDEDGTADRELLPVGLADGGVDAVGGVD